MDKDNNLANMKIFENNNYSRPKNNEENYVVNFAMPKDAISQFSEGLFNLQTEIDTLKKQTGNNKIERSEQSETFSNSEGLLELRKRIDELDEKITRLSDNVIENEIKATMELKEEIKGMTNSFRGDMYDMNDKLEDMGRVISDRVFVSLNSEIKESLFGENSPYNALIARVVESMEKKIDLKFDELKSSMDKLDSSDMTDGVEKEVVENENYQLILEKISNLEQKLEDVSASKENVVEPCDEFTVKLQEKDKEIARLQEALNRANEQFEEKVEYPYTNECNEIDNLSLINEKLDEIKNNQKVVSNGCDLIDVSSIENIISEKNNEISEVLEDKYQLIKSEIDYLKSEVFGKCINESEPDDRVMLMLEKIYNQVSNLLEDNRSEIDNIRSEIDRFKKNFTTVTEGAQVADGKDELQDSLDGLKNELDNLSKLINDQSSDTEMKEEKEIPSNVQNVTEDIENLTKEIIEGEEK